MNRLSIILVLAVLSTPALAQEDKPDKMPDNCGPTKEVFNFLRGENAAPTVAGITRGRSGDRAMSIWQSAKGDRWALIVTDREGISCIIQSGSKIITAPYKALPKPADGDDV